MWISFDNTLWTLNVAMPKEQTMPQTNKRKQFKPTIIPWWGAFTLWGWGNSQSHCSSCYNTWLRLDLRLWQESAWSSKGLWATGHCLLSPGCGVLGRLALGSSGRGGEAGCSSGAPDRAGRGGGSEASLGGAEYLAAAGQCGYPWQPCANFTCPLYSWCGVKTTPFDCTWLSLSLLNARV